MYRVNDSQVEFILSDIKARGIVLDDLQNNLVDHMCCIIENEMPENADFNSFYKELLPRFFQKELKEIQEETNNLLTFKHYFAMKKTLKISGLASAIILLTGAIFKVFHLPGAAIMILSGALLFSIVFMPLMIALKFRDEEKLVDKLVLSLGFLIGIVTMLGIVFKLQHWPGANVMLIGGLGSFVFIYIPLYFFTRIRRAELRFNTIVNAVLMMAMGGMLFALMNLGPSKEVSHSIYASYDFLQTQTHDLAIKNKNMAHAVTGYDSLPLQLYNNSLQLFNYVDECKAEIISKVDGISIEEARNMNAIDLKHPGDHYKVNKVFIQDEGLYSLKQLKKEVDQYNQSIKRFDTPNTLMPIDVEQLRLKHTTVYLLLVDLSQIQQQCMVNSFGYLNRMVK